MTTRLTITLCGSLTRAADHLARVHRALALNGHLVHAPVPALDGEPAPTPEQVANLTTRHHAAIRRSDLVIGIAPDGRVGDATRGEMDYAADRGIPTRWVLSDADLVRLFFDIAAGSLAPAEVAA